MKRFLPLLFIIGLFVACSTPDHRTEYTVPTCIRIAPNITRVTDLDFDTGDRIGLTVVRDGVPYCENTPLRYDGAVFSSTDLMWYDDPNGKSTFTAYYPYSEAGVPTRFSIRSDQRQRTDYEASDLLAALQKNVTPSVSAINMTFVHLMTRLTIDITNETDDTIETVTLKGCRCEASLDLSVPSVQVDNSTAVSDIAPFSTTTAGRYEAILVPQQVALQLEIRTSDGKIHAQKFRSGELQSGSHYTIEACISATQRFQASIRGTIQGWTEAGTIAPEPENNDSSDSTDGLSYGGSRYRTVRFSDGTTWMAENLHYLPTDHTIATSASEQAGIWYPCTISHAASSDDAFVKRQGLLYDIETATTLVLSADNFDGVSGVQGICPEGWRLPTEADFKTLMELKTEIPESFFTFAGIRSASGSYNGTQVAETFSKSYLLGTTAASDTFSSDDTVYICLMFTQNGLLSLAELNYRSGIPVRCVKDAQ